jgi:ABC-type branched-subunit amino acid transport system ATPase component
MSTSPEPGMPVTGPAAAAPVTPGSEARAEPTAGETAGRAGAILRVTDLRVRFGGVQAVAGATFDVRRGTITGLIGPNGAGKSTAVNAIAGQMHGAAGHVVFEDNEILGRRVEEISRLGLRRSFQTANLFGRMTVMENLLMGAPPWSGESLRASLIGRRKWHRREAELTWKALGIMEDFGVASLADELADNLSGGQKRIVELMRTIMGEPTMMLLDEPLAGINPTLAGTIGDHLLALRDAGITMLVIEHDLALVERMCDPVIVMAQGKVLSEGSLSDLRRHKEVVSAYLTG